VNSKEVAYKIQSKFFEFYSTFKKNIGKYLERLKDLKRRSNFPVAQIEIGFVRPSQNVSE
jgi:hypothetical protein